MNNIKKNRTQLKVTNSKIQRFTFNKTAKDQPRYENIQPKFEKCLKTNVGCKKCYGYNYIIQIDSSAFNNNFPEYGNLIAINPVCDIENPLVLTKIPLNWSNIGTVISSGFTNDLIYDYKIYISIENDKQILESDIRGIYFFNPVATNFGLYTGEYKNCKGEFKKTQYLFKNIPIEDKF